MAILRGKPARRKAKLLSLFRICGEGGVMIGDCAGAVLHGRIDAAVLIAVSCGSAPERS
jgi:hypothetical protein